MNGRVAFAVAAILSAGVACVCAPIASSAAEPAANAGEDASSLRSASSGATWITLGTVGGPPLHGDAAPIANALVVGDAVYLFDVGNSVLRQLDAAGVAARNIRGVFVSHHHIDHNADLGLVIVQHWLFGIHKPLPVFGPPGTVAMVGGLVAANAPTELASFAVAGRPNPPMGSAVASKDLPATIEDPLVVHEDGLIRVSAISVDHYRVAPVAPLASMPTAVAYRIEAGGRSFVYSGDTGPSARLRRLAQGADVLITEVVDVPAISAALSTTQPQATPEVLKGIAGNMSANHLEPEQIADLAEAAGIRRVVLTHFVPKLSSMGDAQALAQRIARRYRGTVTLARDLDRF